MDIKISGIDEVQALLKAAPERIVRNAFARSLAAASVPVVRAVGARTPAKTGNLASHLMTDIAIHADGRGGTAQVGFGSEGWKARLVEFGHRMVGHEPDKKEMAEPVIPHPFMAPAAAASAEAAVEAFAQAMKESLTQDILKHAS